MQARAGDGALLVQGADDHVVEHRESGERLHQLEGAADAGGADLVGAKPVYPLFLKKNFSRIRRVNAGDQVEDGGLAGAVGADEGVDAALRDLEGGLVHRAQPAKRFRDTADAQHFSAPAAVSARAAARRRRAGT